MTANKSKSFREYTSINLQQNHWGIKIKTAGYSSILPGEEYPEKEHPSEYYFTWRKGRILNEYQIILITHGSGEFESASCRLRKIEPGTVLIIFKGEWHRYRPFKTRGWTEYWIGFDGEHAEQIIKNSLFVPSKPLIKIPNDARFVQLKIELLNLLEEKAQGNEKIVACNVPVLLAMLERQIRNNTKNTNSKEYMVNKFQVILIENYLTEIDFKQIADKMKISYTWLRRSYKEVVGLSPHQFVLKLRLQKARDLLTLHPNKQIKEIALESGFNSPYYFSKYFKAETGISPAEYREQQNKSGF